MKFKRGQSMCNLTNTNYANSAISVNSIHKLEPFPLINDLLSSTVKVPVFLSHVPHNAILKHKESSTNGSPLENTVFDIYGHDDSPRAKTIHVIMRPEVDGEQVKLTEQEKKNIKKQLKNVF